MARGTGYASRVSTATIPLYDEDFLLENEPARALYHEHAKGQPIIDYHCHLPPEQVASNHRFRSLTEVWLEGDHYKWRAMRTNGIDERLITGGASDFERFEAWAQTVPRTLRNPLYHWTHLELKDPFGIRDRLLGASTARGIFEQANASLATDAFTTQGLMRHFRVAVVCTTDDPADDLTHHRAHAASAASAFVRMYPTFRPDKALAIEEPAAFRAYLDKLEARSGIAIKSYATLLEALERRHTAFHEVGCRLSDHGLETLHAVDYDASEVARTFARALAG